MCAWFGHMTADASQTLEVIRSNVKVMTQKTRSITSKVNASLCIIAHEHVHVLMARGYVDDSLLPSSGSGVKSCCLQSRQSLLILTDVNSVNTNGCHE